MAPGNAGHSPVLLARIQEKKLELENLRQLRDMSAELARQMDTLESKLSTLSNGTEGIPFRLLNERYTFLWIALSFAS